VWKYSAAYEFDMPGLVPGIHVFLLRRKQDVDGRDEPGHDEIVDFRSPLSSLRPRARFAVAHQPIQMHADVGGFG
jgi:hypothetical protein